MSYKKQGKTPEVLALELLYRIILVYSCNDTKERYHDYSHEGITYMTGYSGYWNKDIEYMVTDVPGLCKLYDKHMDTISKSLKILIQ
jgi:hypothetical protein